MNILPIYSMRILLLFICFVTHLTLYTPAISAGKTVKDRICSYQDNPYPIHKATSEYDDEAMRCLIENGVQINQLKNGVSVIEFIFEDQWKTTNYNIDLLLQNGATLKTHKKPIIAYLKETIDFGQARLYQLRVQYRNNLWKHDETEFHRIERLTEKEALGRIKFVEKFIDAGADLHGKYKEEKLKGKATRSYLADIVEHVCIVSYEGGQNIKSSFTNTVIKHADLKKIYTPDDIQKIKSDLVNDNWDEDDRFCFRKIYVALGKQRGSSR